MRHFVNEISKSGTVKLSDKKENVGLPHVRRTSFKGLPIDVELDIGMMANGVDKDGVPWCVTYTHPYGEIPMSLGSDGDPVDVYIGPGDSELVYIVHQVKQNGKFDEDKVFLGFNSPVEATQCYFEHGPKWGFGSIETMTFDQFLNGYLVSNRRGGFGPAPLLIVDSGATF
jgi:hypothetical protein